MGAPAGLLRDPHLDEHLVGLHRSGEQIDEELRGRHGTPPTRPHDDHLGVQCHHRRQQVTGWISVHQCTTERAPMPDLRIADRLRGQRQQRGMLANQRIVDHIVMGGHGPDDDGVAIVAGPAQFADLVQVHQHRRRSQA